MEIFTVRIVYKSGYTVDFECTDFSYTTSGGELREVSWEPIEGRPQPLIIGVTEIAAVWKVGTKEE